MGIKQEKWIIMLKKIQSSSNLCKFLTITSPISYNNNVLYFLSTYKTSFISISRKNKKQFYF